MVKTIKLNIPKIIILPVEDILKENINCWNSPKCLAEEVERDYKRSRYIQDGYVVDFPTFNHFNVTDTTKKQLKWFSTQGLGQYGFIAMYNYLNDNNDNLEQLQSNHVRNIEVFDDCMKYRFCSDIVNTPDYNNKIKHCCYCIHIKWNNRNVDSTVMNIETSNTSLPTFCI